MKSERRHELQHNDLAEWFVDTYELIAPYKNAILGVTLLVAVAAIGLAIWHNRSVGQTEEAWNKFDQVPLFLLNEQYRLVGSFQNPQVIDYLQKVSGDYSGTSAGQWAQIYSSDTLLCAALGPRLMTDPKASNQFFATVADNYQKALATSLDPLAREQAMFGRARVLESLGKLAEAAEAYNELNKEFPNGIYKGVAEQSLKQLEKPETAELYKALADYNPKPKTEKDKEKPTAGPHGKLESITPLPENPPETSLPENPPLKPETGKEASKSSAAPVISSTTSLAPKTEKTEAAKPQATGAGVPKAEAPKPEAPKSGAPKSEPPKPHDSSAAPATNNK